MEDSKTTKGGKKAESATAPVLEGAVPAQLTELAATLDPAALQQVTSGIVGLGSQIAADPAPVTASEADIVNELEKGGPAFGGFLKSVGLAVAETQEALDKTLAKTAETLSTTEINIVAVFEQEIDNEGNMGASKMHMQKVPLIAYLMPTAYAFREVHLRAEMDVSEFNVANGLNIKKNHVDFNLNAKAKYGIGGFGVSGGTNLNVTHDDVGVNASSSQDRAAGKLHLEATLEPRTDVRLPQPYIVQKGPKLRLLLQKREDLDAAGNPVANGAPVAGRRLTIGVELLKVNGEGLDGASLDLSCSDPTLSYEISGATAGGGKATITIRRTGAAFDPAKTVTAEVRAWKNLITASVPVTL